jgi:tetratricopeptide (TPR) repeat protein
MDTVMSFAPSNRRAFSGLFLAMTLIAIGPMVAVAQFGNVRTVPNGYPPAKSPAGYRGANVAPPKRDSLFGDQGLSFKLPFTRSKSPAKPSIVPGQPMMGRSMPRAAMQAPRVAAGPPNSSSVPSRVPMTQRQAMPNNYQPRQVAQGTVQTGPAYMGAAPRRIPQQTNSPMPRPMPAAAQAAAVPLTQNTPVSPHAPVTPKSSPNSSDLPGTTPVLAQAHLWSTKAKTVNDFSRIIDACRQAGTEQSTPEINRYANQLAAWALNRRGQLNAEAGRDKEALKDFDAALEANSKCWRAVHNRGVLLAGNGEFEKAFDDFSCTIDLNPKFAKAYSNRAALFVVSGDVQSAIQDYTHAVELDPTLTVAHRGLGRACHLVGQLDAAVHHYDKAVRLAPNDAYAIASRADVLTDSGRYAEAAAEYERAIQVNPNLSHAYSGSAWLLATCPDDSIRDPRLALERAQAAVELTRGEDAASFDTLAAAQANNGEFAAATKSVQQAVYLATPGEKEAYRQRLSLYQQERPYRLEPTTDITRTSHESQE